MLQYSGNDLGIISTLLRWRAQESSVKAVARRGLGEMTAFALHCVSHNRTFLSVGEGRDFG